MENWRERWGSLSRPTQWRVLILLALLVGAILPISIALLSGESLPGLLLNFGTEMAGAFVTFILIDMIIARYEAQEEEASQSKYLRERLINKMSSGVNDEARRAAEELRELGWLFDGTLERHRMTGANLKGCDLRHANLRGVRMFRSDLREAKLFEADLENAIMTGCDLRGAILYRTNIVGARMAGTNLEGARRLTAQMLVQTARLKGAILPDGARYDGRYRLYGDLNQAVKHCKSKNYDIDDPEVMATWYDVPLEVYADGQRWADEHLDSLRKDDDPSDDEEL